MVACECHEWHVNWPKLQTALIGGWSYGVSYQGTPFENCPWCGKKLGHLPYWESELPSFYQKELEEPLVNYARVYP